jgi:hypothetical protein
MAGTRWDSWTQVQSEWLRSDESARLGEECQSLLYTEFGEAPLFVLKDPRMCRLMPFWLPVVATAGIIPSAVLVVRNPQDVARSLERRNAIPTTTALLMWLRHVLDAESQTRLIRRSIVRCEDMHEHWLQLAEQISTDLGIKWAPRSIDADREISRFSKSGHRKHEPRTTSLDVPVLVLEWLHRTTIALDTIRGGHPDEVEEAVRTLDDVRMHFDQTTSIVSAVADGLEAQRSADVSFLENQLAAAESQLHAIEACLVDTRSATDVLRGQLAESLAQRDRAEAQRIAQDAEKSELLRQRDGLQGRVDHLQDRALELEIERARLAAQVVALYESKSWRITAPLRAVWGMLTSRKLR